MTTIAFPDDHLCAIGLLGASLAPLGFHCVIAGDHDEHEEIAEVRRMGEDIAAMMVHPMPDGRFEASHLSRNIGGAFATLEDALDWVGDTLRDILVY